MSAPRVRFVVGGVQKGGTTALAAFLQRHPGVALPADKEAHVFDAPDFDDGWSPEQVDARFAAHFGEPAEACGAKLHGDATPIYLMHERLIGRIARYNPQMRWIILLRHPVERALSQYHMERSRGDEHWPLWLALLAERWRLRGHEDDFSTGSPLRHHSYRLRGDYARQLDALYAAFPREQILLLRNEQLREDPAATVDAVCRFLGLEAPAHEQGYGTVFSGQYERWPAGSWRWKVVRWWWRRQLAEQVRHGLHWQ